jgi:hypothetical protein
VRVEVILARSVDDAVHVDLWVKSSLECELTIQSGEIGLVGPDEQVHFAKERHTIQLIQPGQKHRLSLRFDVPPAYSQASGYLLQLDGFSSMGRSIPLQPIPLGHPVTSQAREARSTTRGHPDRSIAPKAVAPPPEPRTCVALPMRRVNVPAESLDRVDAFLHEALADAGLSPTVTDAQVAEALVSAATRDKEACDQAACLLAVARAAGARFVVAGKVAGLDRAYVITLRLMDAVQEQVVSRATGTTSGDEQAMRAALGAAAQQLVAEAGL